jgi:tetratricopeptide (TPR) repeat protein
MTEYAFNLGPHTRKISTTSDTAQQWFNRGLNWMFAYNYEEAQACFQSALEHDPNCAMAHWGTAYAVGPNYNKPWELFDAQDIAQTLEHASGAIAKAKEHAGNITAVEQALIGALDKRYQSDKPVADLYTWSSAYADAMREACKNFPNDWDLTALFVESMMNRTPWQMWDPRSGEPVEGADTLECREVLEQAIAKVEAAGQAQHPGLLHLYVHLMEMSPMPEVALKAADELRSAIPDAGHLKHMSTHIDVLCGNYKDVVAGNTAAIQADRKFVEHAGVMNFYSLYRVHNFHFKLYGAMFLGQYEQAIDAFSEMRKTVPEELLKMESPPMVNWLEGYLSMDTHVLIRFGRWQALIDAPLPEDTEFYSMTTAMNYYGKGIAQAALGNHAGALEAQRQFEEAVAKVADERFIHVVSCQQILGVAREMLAGEVNYHHGEYETAFSHLRQAVINEDSLPYDEPWGWMMPSRHALGALLLEQGHVEEAMAAYEADLGLDDSVIRSNQHPDNVWALVGLDKCYRKLGKIREAQLIKPRLAFALSRADKEITRSCFCSMRDAL